MRNRTDLESHKSMTSEGQQLFREFRSDIMQLQASAVPPNLTRGLEAKSESQKTEIQSLQRDSQSTHDFLNNWDGSNFNSIQGVCVDESVGTSIHQ